VDEGKAGLSPSRVSVVVAISFNASVNSTSADNRIVVVASESQANKDGDKQYSKGSVGHFCSGSRSSTRSWLLFLGRIRTKLIQEGWVVQEEDEAK